MSPPRLSSRWFIAVWVCAWLMSVGGVLSAGAHFRAGFVWFIIAAPLLLFLGLSLAMNVGELSDRMTREVTRRGWVLVVFALFGAGVGIVGLAR